MNQRPVIFLAFANDHQDYLYKLTEEQHRIREALERVAREGLCEVIYETDTDLRRIWTSFDKYQDRIAVFHYGGHADDYALLLKKASGEPQLAHGKGLVSFLGQQKGLQLVFINGCSTKRQAEELVEQGVPAVIGTSEPVNDTAATELSVAFYEGLAAGRSLQQAWMGARDLVRAQRGDQGYQRGIKISGAHGPRGLGFPWEMYLRPGAESVQDWNLPRAAQNPLFGLPLPEAYFLRLPNAPFVGLHYFREDDAAVFFGRGAQIRELYNHIKGIHPIILMYGKSGVGKSSMLDAGLVPRIKDNYEIAYARRSQEKGLLGTLEVALDELLEDHALEDELKKDIAPNTATDPLEEARQLLRAAASKVDDPRLQQQLERMLASLQPPATEMQVELTGLLRKWQAIEQRTQKPVIVMLDQVEEKFTRPIPGGGEEQQDELVHLLTAIQPLFNRTNSGIRGKLIFSYRKEYHPEIRDTFRALALPYAELFLKRLDREGIIEAVRGVNLNPVTQKRYQLTIEENLPEIIADDLVEDPESPIAPVLQIILVKLWETAFEREGEPVHFTVRQYQELRKQGTTMGEFFQQQREILAREHPLAVNSGLALDLLRAHTTSMGTSGSRRRVDLFQQYELKQDQLSIILQKMEQLSLLNRIDSGTDDNNHPEQDSYATILAHDTLAPVVIREFTISDTPGQRAARILNNKLADISFQVAPAYVEKLRLTGTPPEVVAELKKPYTGRDKFLAVLRVSLDETTFTQQREQLLNTAEINLAPNGHAVYLDESDLDIVEKGAGLLDGSYPGMRKLSPAETLLVEDSRQRRADRIRREEEQQEQKRRDEENKRRLIQEKLNIQRKSLRRLYYFTGGIFLLLVVAAALGLWAKQQEGLAIHEARKAQSTALAAKAQEVNSTDPTVALNLALAAYATDPTQQAIAAIAYVLRERRTVFYTSREQFSVEAYSKSRMAEDDFEEFTFPYFFVSPEGSKLALSFPNHNPDADYDTTYVLDLSNSIGPVTLDQDYGVYDIGDEPSLQFATDGSFLITQWQNLNSGNDGLVWDLVKDGPRPQPRWDGGDFRNFGLSFFSSKLLLFGFDSLKVWDFNTEKYDPTLVFDDKESGSIRKGAITDDGRKILGITNNRNRLFVWEITDADSLRQICQYGFADEAGKDTDILSATFSPDGSKIVVVTKAAKVHLLDANETKILWTLDQSWAEMNLNQIDLITNLGGDAKTAIQPEVVSAGFSPDGSKVITLARYVFHDPFVKAWNVEDGTEWFSLKGFQGVTYSAAYSPDNTYITTASALISVAGGGDSVLIEPEIIKWGTHPWHSPLDLTTDENIQRIGFLSNDMVTIDASHKPEVWKINTRAPASQWSVQKSTIDTDRLTTKVPVYDDAGNLLLWQFSDQQKMIPLPMNGPRAMQHLNISPQGRTVAGSIDSFLYLLDTPSASTFDTITAHSEEITAIAFSPNGELVYTAGLDGVIKAWEVNSRESAGHWEVTVQEDPITTIAISPDGKQVAFGTKNGRAELWELNSEQEPITWNQEENGLNAFAGYDFYKSLRPPPKEYEVEVDCIRFSPQGDRILIASYDRIAGAFRSVIRVWDISTKTALFTLNGENHFRQVEYSQDDAHILSLDSKGKVQIWTDPIGSLKNGLIYQLTAQEREAYGITVDSLAIYGGVENEE